MKLCDSFHAFIKPRQILEFNSTGAVFTGFDEIKIKIPPNAIPDGVRGRLEVGVCLYGPFMFEENYSPISPILWLCLQENIHLAKPIRVTLRHILPDLSEEDLASFGVRLAEASCDCVTNASGESLYKFQPSLDKASCYSIGGKGYGVLQTDHDFCFMCLEAESTTDDEMAQHIGYCLTCVQGPSTLWFFATYFLNACLAVSDIHIYKPECIILLLAKGHGYHGSIAESHCLPATMYILTDIIWQLVTLRVNCHSHELL